MGQYRVRIERSLSTSPFILDNLSEAVQHAIVSLGASSRSCLQLTKQVSPSMPQFDREKVGNSYTRVLTTSNGYLRDLRK